MIAFFLKICRHFVSELSRNKRCPDVMSLQVKAAELYFIPFSLISSLSNQVMHYKAPFYFLPNFHFHSICQLLPTSSYSQFPSSLCDSASYAFLRWSLGLFLICLLLMSFLNFYDQFFLTFLQHIRNKCSFQVRAVTWPNLT